MSQITHGVRAVLSSPAIYTAFQSIMGAHGARTRFVREFVRPSVGERVLDLGCGPADILNYLPAVDYWGYDISEAYIKQATSRFSQRGKFHCQHLQFTDLEQLPSFDIVLALGLLHHLEDAQVISILNLARQALKPGGRLVTVDPCLDETQNPVARFLVKNDRGQNVRDKASYAALADSVFEGLRIEVRHQKWIPYTHCFMECTRN